MLDARQLEALTAVVEHGGFGPAAQALSLTLPAVSVRIKALEDGLGQRLLVRGKRVRATAAGQALLAHVKQVQMMEADVLEGLQAGASVGSGSAAWQSLSVAIHWAMAVVLAINADNQKTIRHCSNLSCKILGSEPSLA